MAKVTEEQKTQVREWTTKWVKHLKLDRYTIDIKFHNRKTKTTKDEIVFADTICSYAGLEADINIWLPFWSLTDYQKERVCVHELVHVLLPSISEEDTCTATEILWSLV